MKKLLLIAVGALGALLANGQCPTAILGPSTICSSIPSQYYYQIDHYVAGGSWSITPGSGTVVGSNSAFAIVTWNLPGGTLTYSKSGCTSISLPVSVGTNGSIPFPTVPTGPAGICAGSSGVYSIPVQSGFSVQATITSLNSASVVIPTVTVVGQNATVSLGTPGTYLLLMTYSTGTCMGPIPNSTFGKTITCTAGNQAVSITQSGIACPGNQTTFTATGDLADTFSWTLSGGGTVTPTGNPATVTWGSTPGSFTVTATGHNACQPDRSNTPPLSVTVNQSPDPAITGATSICAGTSTNYSTPAVAGHTYAWFINGTNSGVTNAISPSLAAGAYTFIVTETVTASGCSKTTPNFNVTAYAVPTTATAGPDQAICNTSAFTLAGNNPTIGTGVWTVASGSASISNVNSYNSTVTVPTGSATLRWTISNGMCPSSYDDVVLRRDAPPTLSNAGPDQVKCNVSAFIMAGNTPTVGTGLWSFVTGSGTIGTPTSPTSTVAIPVGTAVTLRWTISNGVCASSTDDVILSNQAPPTSNAGPDINHCNNSSFTMAATPAGGVWSVMSGTATIASIYSATSAVTITTGTATLRWTMQNGTCFAMDDVTLSNVAANAGPDIAQCGNSSFKMAANSPFPGSGSWSMLSGTGSIIGAGSSAATVADIFQGHSATLRWTITNGSCTSSDTMVVTNQIPATSNAGPDISHCNNNLFTMAGYPYTGTWSVVAGPPAMVTVNNPNSGSSTVTVTAGYAVTLRWTTQNGICVATDDVVLSNAVGAYAGPDAAQCNNSSFTISANTPSAGVGSWSILSGTATITSPNSPTTTVTVSTASAVLQWTITNGSCNTSDNVVLTNQAPVISNAGADQSNCNNNLFTMAGNTPSFGSGTWSVVAGNASMVTINSPNSGTSTVTVSAGYPVTLRWTLQNGTCIATDDVNLSNAVGAYAGPDLTQCNNSIFTMASNTPSAGTGSWSVVSGTATITTPSSQSTTVTGVSGAATLRWTISGVTGSCSTSDDLIVTNSVAPGSITSCCGYNLCLSSHIQLDAGAGTNYHWTTPMGNTTTSYFIATVVGTYSVTYTNTYGCPVSASAAIYTSGGNCAPRIATVQPLTTKGKPVLALNAVIKPKDKVALPTVQSDLEGHALVYPVPADRVITVQVPDGSGGTIKLIDLTGKILYNDIFEEGCTQKQIDVSQHSDGMYLLMISGPAGYTPRKVIIQHAPR